MMEHTNLRPRRQRPRTGLAVPIVLAVPLLFGGCVNRDMSDLVRYADKVNAQKSHHIEPLPDIKVPEVYAYASAGKTDPFKPLVQEKYVPKPEEVIVGGIRPPANHVPEELEAYPLDSLRMVGTLSRGDETWGLITAPDGAVHRVQAGNYLGQNYGRVLAVGEDHVELVEIVPDRNTGWRERPAKLDLSE